MATIIGGAGADQLVGGAEDDLLLAGAGADTLDGGAGDDRAVIDRAAAMASITFFALPAGLTTTLDGGLTATGIEHFSLITGAGDDSLVGGAGDDSLTGGGGADALAGGTGDDTLDGGAGNDTLLGGIGADLLRGGGGADRFVLTDAGLGTAASTLAAMLRIADFDATAGDRLALRGQTIGAAIEPQASFTFALAGQPARPIVFAGSLAATGAPVAGLALPDATEGAVLRLFWQPDTASGGWLLLDLDGDAALGAADLVVRLDLPGGTAITAADFLSGTFALAGTLGADLIAGGDADDHILGLDGADTLTGGVGADLLRGGAGDDLLAGDAGVDTLEGGEARDTLLGGGGTDVLTGGAGDDRLEGGEGADLLVGGPGDDLLIGGEGDDRLEAGLGADTLLGGAGADTFQLGAPGDDAWSTLSELDRIADFFRAEGDRLRLDGLALPLVFSGSTGPAQSSLATGFRLPSQRLPGNAVIEAHWVPAQEGGAPAGGWLVVDLNRNGLVGPNDLVVRIGSVDAPATITAADFVANSLLRFAAVAAPLGTAGDDLLEGGLLSETFVGTTGDDTIDGGAGAGNAISYAGFAEPISVTVAGRRAVIIKGEGGGVDVATDVHAFIGTAGEDTLSGAYAPASLFVVSLEGRGGIDLLVGDGGPGVQAAYGGSPGAVSVNLALGTADDGWGATDYLVGIRRVALTSQWDDSLFGSVGDDTVLSGTAGNKVIDGQAGRDIWRYVGSGAVSVNLVLGAAYKPGGIDRLTGVEGAYAGDGNDSLLGSAFDDTLAGGPGNDTLTGGNGFDTADFGLYTAASGLPTQGVVVDLTAGVATDPWGGTDRLATIEHAWGTALGDRLTGFAIAGNPTWLRGLAGDDTLRAPVAGTLIGADYTGDPLGIAADLGAGSVADGFGGIDTLVNITTIRGSALADSIRGSAAVDRLEGGAGDDTLDGGSGADRLIGGAGDDLLRVDNVGEVLVEVAGGGYDTAITTVSYNMRALWIEVLILAAGAGNIFGIGNEQDNLLIGNESNNRLVGEDGSDTVRGLAGDDVLEGLAGNDLLEGGDGRDVLRGGDLNDTQYGGAGDDILNGDAFHDRLFGEDGNDTIYAGTGSDFVYSGFGNDRVLAASGHDWIEGGPGSDYLYGSTGNDTIDGGTERDTVDGGWDNDVLWGGGGYVTDSLRGDLGNDTLDGSARPGTGPRNLGEYDHMYGGPGDDVYFADSPTDHIVELEFEGNDTVYLETRKLATYTWNWIETVILLGPSVYGCGNALANTIVGTGLRNVLKGRAGDDTLDAGAGDDALYGEAGADTFVLRPGGGSDTIADFTPGEDSLRFVGFDLDFEGLLAGAVQSGPHLVLSTGGFDQVLLRYVLLADLQPEDVVFQS